MSGSERKRRALRWMSRNNLVAVIVSGVFAIFLPQFAPIGGIVADQAEQAVDARVEQHCEKHGGCE